MGIPIYPNPQTKMERAAVLRLMSYAGRAMTAQDRGDWVACADFKTSCDDAREALRAAMREAGKEV